MPYCFKSKNPHYRFKDVIHITFHRIFRMIYFICFSEIMFLFSKKNSLEGKKNTIQWLKTKKNKEQVKFNLSSIACLDNV